MESSSLWSSHLKNTEPPEEKLCVTWRPTIVSNSECESVLSYEH